MVYFTLGCVSYLRILNVYRCLYTSVTLLRAYTSVANLHLISITSRNRQNHDSATTSSNDIFVSVPENEHVLFIGLSLKLQRDILQLKRR